MIISVPKTLEEVIAKVVEIIEYLEEEDRRRTAWEAEVLDDLEEMDERIEAIDSRVYALETADDA